MCSFRVSVRDTDRRSRVGSCAAKPVCEHANFCTILGSESSGGQPAVHDNEHGLQPASCNIQFNSTHDIHTHGPHAAPYAHTQVDAQTRSWLVPASSCPRAPHPTCPSICCMHCWRLASRMWPCSCTVHRRVQAVVWWVCSQVQGHWSRRQCCWTYS